MNLKQFPVITWWENGWLRIRDARFIGHAKLKKHLGINMTRTALIHVGDYSGSGRTRRSTSLSRIRYPMNKSKKTFLACAAMAGLYAGAITAQAAPARTHSDEAGTKITKVADKDKASCSGKDGCSGKDSCKGAHDCKGKNACKGQGGCKSGDNGCKAKNSCKGKGGCSTAKKPEPSKEG